MPRRPLSPAAPALVALFSSGSLAPYLLPTLVGRLGADFGLTPTQAGGIGSALLLASAGAGLGLASRVAAVGAARLARAGLALLAAGFGLAAAAPAGALPLLLAGCLLGGLGSGTVTAVAAAGTAAEADPHRVPVLGLLTTSAVAGALYLALPHLGGGHRLPFACIAGWALLSLSRTGRLKDGGERHSGGDLPAAAAARRTRRPPLPARTGGVVLASGIFLWSLAQNSLWGVSGRIGLDRAGLSESLLGLVFALALGAGLLGTVVAGALGNRFGRALPIGLGTAVIGCCVAVSATARSAGPFSVGEISWNSLYPFVLSHLLALAARLDARGRWAVLVGSASSLGVACGPITGTLLSVHAGFAATGWTLGAVLLLVAPPLALVARRSDRGRLPAPVPAPAPVCVPVPMSASAPLPVPVPAAG